MRQRLKKVFTKEQSTVGNVEQTWDHEPHDLLLYSINIRFTTSKPPILCNFEHGKVGTSHWISYHGYANPLRHGTRLATMVWRFDRPEFIPQDERIAVSFRTNEATDIILIYFEYEVVKK